jgi:hypothetical protein
MHATTLIPTKLDSDQLRQSYSWGRGFESLRRILAPKQMERLATDRLWVPNNDLGPDDDLPSEYLDAVLPDPQHQDQSPPQGELVVPDPHSSNR